VATSLNAKATIVDSHPLAAGVPGLYSRDCANRALLEADLVFFIGSHAGGQDTLLRQEVYWPRVVGDPAHVWKLSAREPGDPLFAPGRWDQGPRCEPRGETTATNEPGKSDRPIDTEEAFEQKPGKTRLAEEVEGRGLTKGKTFHHNKLRTQNRERSRYGRR
jgi:hypothetical protein